MSASSIGVTGWTDMVGCRSSRTMPVGRCGEESAEGLPAADRRGRDNDGCPAGGSEPEFRGATDGSDVRGAVEGGADLVVHDGCAEVAQSGEDLRKMCVHPLGRPAARVAGDADPAHSRETPEIAGVGQGQEEDRGEACEVQDLHHRRRSGEVVTIPADERAGGEGAKGAHPP